MKTLLEYIVNNHVKCTSAKYGNINDDMKDLNDIHAGDYFEIHEFYKGKESSCLYGLAETNAEPTKLNYKYLVDMNNNVHLNSYLTFHNYASLINVIKPITIEHIHTLDDIGQYINDNITNPKFDQKIGYVKNDKFIPVKE